MPHSGVPFAVATTYNAVSMIESSYGGFEAVASRDGGGLEHFHHAGVGTATPFVHVATFGSDWYADVSLIQSNYSTVGFGSGLVVDGAGFVLHNRGGGFTLDAASPNVLAGRKRPLHTIIPAFMEKDDVRIAFGIMGGWNQAQARAQFVSNVVDFGMNVQGALDVPRFSKDTFEGCDVNLESRIPESTRQALTARGHQLVMRGDFSSTRMGAGQAVLRNFPTGVNHGASDPRKDGAAIAELLPARNSRPSSLPAKVKR